MQSLLELLKKSEEFLSKKGIDNARLQAELLFAHALKCRRLDLYLQFERPMTANEIDVLRGLLVRRGAREPVQYIIGDTDFRGLTLKCDKRALIPRPETEELLDYVFSKLPSAGTPARVLDLGTGTGAIALSIAVERPGTCLVAADKSEDALALAKENAQKIGGDALANVQFVHSDWFCNVDGKFDAIVSNPPYLTNEEWSCAQPEVKNFEPLSALVADNAGIADLERIIMESVEYLKPGGFIALETGIAQHEELFSIAKKAGLSSLESLNDISGRQRFFFAQAPL